MDGRRREEEETAALWFSMREVASAEAAEWHLEGVLASFGQERVGNLMNGRVNHHQAVGSLDCHDP